MGNVQHKMFSGSDTQAIFEQIKEELGEDAIILNILHSPDGEIQVSAAPSEDRQMDVAPEPDAVNMAKGAALTAPLDKQVETFGRVGRRSNGDEVTDLRIALEVSEGFAGDFLRLWRSTPGALNAKVEAILKQMVRLAESVKFCERFVCVVGPSGSGKTSTAFKLASKLNFDCDIRAGVLHLDVSSPPPLRDIDIPVVSCPLSAMTPAGFGKLLREFSACEIVFVDLPTVVADRGVDFAQVERMAGLMGGVEFLFTADSCLQASFLQRSIDSLACFGLTKVALTKIDEGPALGPALSVLHRTEVPVAFLANGPVIPSDIEPASYSRLAWLFAKQIARAGFDVETLSLGRGESASRITV
jgi:flagellar biosynthesis GTPase FlhF